MRSTFNFINTYFWKSIYAPFMAFGIPIILLIVLGNIFRVEYAFPGIISLTTLIISILILPLTLSDLKKTSAFKFLGASPIGRVKFTVIILGYFIVIATIAISLLFVVLLIFFHKDVFSKNNGKSYWVVDSQNIKDVVSNVVIVDNGVLSGFLTISGFFMFFFAVLLQGVMGIAVGLLIVTISKTPQQSLTISISILLPTMFLSGMIISVDVIAESPALKWISRFIPFTYTTGNMVEALTPLSHLKLYISGNYALDAAGHVTYSGAINSFAGNDQLRQMIMTKEFPTISGSSRNIFDFNSDYVVRKVPTIDKVKEFMITFLAGGDANHPVPTMQRFESLWHDNILKSDYGFLELFFNQNNVLYTGIEKALNIFIPIWISVGAFWYSIRNFKWSVR